MTEKVILKVATGEKLGGLSETAYKGRPSSCFIQMLLRKRQIHWTAGHTGVYFLMGSRISKQRKRTFLKVSVISC